MADTFQLIVYGILHLQLSHPFRALYFTCELLYSRIYHTPKSRQTPATQRRSDAPLRFVRITMLVFIMPQVPDYMLIKFAALGSCIHARAYARARAHTRPCSKQPEPCACVGRGEHYYMVGSRARAREFHRHLCPRSYAKYI